MVANRQAARTPGGPRRITVAPAPRPVRHTILADRRPSKEPPVPDRTSPATPQLAPGDAPVRLLITAGPTHEPIDAVRFLGNRSSGRLGIALADHAADLGWDVRLLLGPTPLTPRSSRVSLVRFRTTADLRALLAQHLPWCDALIMAAAVADYTPVVDEPGSAEPLTRSGKIRRADHPLTLRLQPTPDLLAECSQRRRRGQLLVGFALEPRDHLLDSARSKLARKNLDYIVANPLETMDADTIEATLLGADHSARSTPGLIPKHDFAPWLLSALAPAIAANLPLRDAASP